MARRLSHLGVLALVCSAAACASEGQESEGGAAQQLTTDETRVQNELDFMKPAYAAYDATETPGSGDTVSTHRRDCSRALIGLLTNPGTIDPKVQTWLDAAGTSMTAAGGTRNAVLERHVVLAVGVDCLLAAAVMAARLPPGQRALNPTIVKVTAGAISMAEWAFGPLQPEGDALWQEPACLDDTVGWARPSCFRKHQMENLGDSRTEEAGLAGAFAYVARNLLPLQQPQVDALLRRGSALLGYSLQTGNQATEGTPFPASGLTANHQMKPNPYYSAGALISLADALAVHRQLGKEALPVGFPETRVLEVLEEVHRGLTAEKRYQGAFDFVNTDGTTRASESSSFNATEIIFAKEPPWATAKNPYLPTDVGRLAKAGRGTIAQYVNPVTKRIRANQYNGGELRSFECDPQWLPGKTRCTAGGRADLSVQWGNIDFGRGMPRLPEDYVDAAPQWTTPDGMIHTRVVRADRIWDYVCDAAPPITCTGERTETLAEHFLQLADPSGAAWNGTTLPTANLDAVSASSDPSGVVRIYYYKEAQLWHERCEPGSGCRKQAAKPIAEQWGSVGGNATAALKLPEVSLDAVTQFYDASGTQITFVYKGGQSWKYTCNGTCTYAYTRPLDDAWSSVIGQERMANVSVRRPGVTDWGLDATSVFNSAFALGVALKHAAMSDRYDEVRAVQLREQRDQKTVLPTTYLDASDLGWSFGAPLAAVTPPSAFSIGAYSATGWWPAQFCAFYGATDPSWWSIGSPTPIADAQAGDRGRSPKGRVGRRGRTTSPRGKPTFLSESKGGRSCCGGVASATSSTSGASGEASSSCASCTRGCSR